MGHEEIKAIKHLVQLGDENKRQRIEFTLKELKYLQGIVISRIVQDWEEKDQAFLPHRELAEKLEYFITKPINPR